MSFKPFDIIAIDIQVMSEYKYIQGLYITYHSRLIPEKEGAEASHILPRRLHLLLV
jgi:hypothetical protein